MSAQEQLKKQIEHLEQLQALDLRIKKLDAQIGEDRTQLDGLRGERNRLDKILEEHRASAADMQKTAGDLMTEARQMSTQIERSREKLARARNERESMAAQRELEELRKLMRDREEEIGKLTTLSDAAKRSLDETTSQRDKIAGELASNEGSLSSSIDTVLAERNQLEKERTEVAKSLPSIILRRYEAVRQKRGSGSARVVNGTCTACHMSLSPQLFQKLQRRESLEQCPSCQRLIYYHVPQAENPEPS